MSYRSSLEVVECDIQMTARNIRKAWRALRKSDSQPESCFLEEVSETAEDADDDATLIRIPSDKFWWSGNHVDRDDLEKIAPMMVGKVTGYFVGEEGTLHGGFQIVDGQFFKCRVDVTVTREVA